jgi:alpha,alpha-trehalose phosphorylase
VAVSQQEATYVLTEGLPMDVTHHGTPLTVSLEAVSLPLPPAPERVPPSQPPGRTPFRRRSIRLT